MACGILIKAVTLDRFENRTAKSGNVYMLGKVLVSTGNSEEAIFLNNLDKNKSLADKLRLLERRSLVIFTAMRKSNSGGWSCSPTTTVMTKVAPFDYSEEFVEKYLVPPLVSIAEARGSAPSKRLSIKGHIKEIGTLTEGPTYKRRRIEVRDDEDNAVEIVLWNDAAVSCETKRETFFQALVKSDYKGQLQSTPATVLTFSERESRSGTVIGTGETDGLTDVLLDDGQIIQVSGKVDLTILKVLPCDVVLYYSAEDDTVVDEISLKDS